MGSEHKDERASGTSVKANVKANVNGGSVSRGSGIGGGYGVSCAVYANGDRGVPAGGDGYLHGEDTAG